MLENGPKPSTSYSFEQLLGWFGRFTPQFKFRLMSLHRQFDAATFENFVRDTLKVFRSLIFDLAKVPKGPERARKVYALVDAEHQASPPTGVSCAAGCGSCCKTFPKQITDDEADLLATLVRTGAAPIDLDELKAQSASESNHMRCLFLGQDDNCRIYGDRPMVCRKYYVTSPAANCETPDTGVVPRIDLMPELIASAAMSLPDNDIGFMPRQLAKRLLEEPS